MEIHTETQCNHGGLQQEFRQALAFHVEGVSQRKSVNQSTQECDGRGDEATGCQNQSHEEEVLVHATECGKATSELSKH